MVRVEKIKKGVSGAVVARRFKILDYLADYKTLALKIKSLMRAWEASSVSKVSAKRTSVTLSRNFPPYFVGRAIDRHWGAKNKLGLLDYITPSVFFQPKVSWSGDAGSTLQHKVHLDFFKNLNELFLNQWRTRFLFNTFLRKPVRYFVGFKRVLNFLIVFCSLLGGIGLLALLNLTEFMTQYNNNAWSGLFDLLISYCSEFQYFFYFFSNWLVQQFTELTCLGQVSEQGGFHIIRWSLKSFFADWENLYAYTEIFNSVVVWLAGVENYLFFVLGAVGIVVLLLYVVALCINVMLMRSDAWPLFFNLSYFMTRGHKFDSLESVNQAVHGNLIALAKNRRLVFGTTVRTREGLTPLNRFCLEYYYTQTIGGVVGFLDLFPTYTTYYNSSINLRVRLKTFNFFNRFRSRIASKLKLVDLEGSKKIGQLAARTLASLKNEAVKYPKGFITNFLRPRFYLESELSYIFNWFDWLRNVSRFGDYGVFKMRYYFFKKAVSERDPWDFFNNEGASDSGRVQNAISPQKINWYGRELNSVVVSQTIISRFSAKSLFRFKVIPRNLINDFSFWKPEINLTGRQTYFSHWDSFAVENQFDVNKLGSSKFAAFERSGVGDEEDESQLEYVIDDAETYFEDGLLHKDFEMIFFDHELEDLFVRGQLDPLFVELNENPKLKSLLNNESMIYKAGQEGDHLEKTTFSHYSNAYSLEYGGLHSYKSGGFESFYDDVADFLAVNGSSILPAVSGIPTDRSFFYWGSNQSIYSNLDKSERIRLGRLFYNYWVKAASFLASGYFLAWRGPFLVLGISALVWSFAFMVSCLWFFSEFLCQFYSNVDVLFLLFVFITFLALVFFSFLVTVIRSPVFRAFYDWWLVNLLGSPLLRVSAVFLSLMCLSLRQRNISSTSGLHFLIERCGLLTNKNFMLTGTPQLNLQLPRIHFSGDRDILQFFFSVRDPFFNFNTFYGVSEYKFLLKIFGLSTTTKSFLKRTVVAWSVSRGVQFNSLRLPLCVQSQTAYFYHRQGCRALVGGVAADFSSPAIFYDFSVLLGLRFYKPHTYLFNVLFADPLRVLTKLKLAGGLASDNWMGGVARLHRYSAAVIRAVQDVNSYDALTVWSAALSDMIFTSIKPTYTLADSLGQNLFKDAGEGLPSGNSFSGIRFNSRVSRSRTRGVRLQFFESRSSIFRGSLYLAAYENFLRLFFSKEILQETYRLRAGHLVGNVTSWSYRSKINFINFATPLQEGRYAGFKNKF